MRRSLVTRGDWDASTEAGQQLRSNFTQGVASALNLSAADIEILAVMAYANRYRHIMA